jgi:hypothetical protein
MLASVVLPAQADNFVYFSEYPAMCAMEPNAYDGQTFSIFMLVDDATGVSGVSFHIDTDRFDAGNVQSVTPRDGVTIVSGNLFDGITLSVDGREFVHRPLLDIVLSGHEPSGYTWTRDIKIIGGGSKDVSDQVTVAQSGDCFGATPVWDVPDAVDVLIGTPDQFTFMAGMNSGDYPPAADVRVSSADGWIDESAIYDVEVVCGWCPWSGTRVEIPVNVPGDVADDTMNEITVEMYWFGQLTDTRTITLHAIDPVRGEESTWGQVKTLYK